MGLAGRPSRSWIACTRQRGPLQTRGTPKCTTDKQRAFRFYPRSSVLQGPFSGLAGYAEQRWPHRRAKPPAPPSQGHSQDSPCRLGSKQAMTSPQTVAVRLNSGATPTPRRAEPPARLGRVGWLRASGSARRNGQARGSRAARTTPRIGLEKKRGPRRALPLVAS